MAVPRQKRPVRRRVYSVQEDKERKARESKARFWLVVTGIVLAAVIVISAVLWLSRPAKTPIGRTMDRGAPVRTEDGASVESTTSESPPVVSGASIVPPLATARMPLSAAYSAGSPGGGVVTCSFRWFVDGYLVQEGPSDTLQPGSYRRGSSVFVEVTPSQETLQGTAFVSPAITIINSPPEIETVSLEPESTPPGASLTAAVQGNDPDGDPLLYTYQWRVNGSNVGAPGGEASFPTSDLHKRDVVSVSVSCSDGSDQATPVFSNSVILQNSSPKIVSSPPLELTGSLYTYQVSARDPDGDRLTYRLERFPSGMTIDQSRGLIRWALPSGTLFTGRNEVDVQVSVDDNDGGRDTQEYTIVATDLFVN